MQPTYYRAVAFGDTTVIHFEELYLLYSTTNYDFCTWNKNIAETLQNQTPKQKRDTMRLYSMQLIKVDSQYSRKYQKSPKEAIKNLIHRKQLRIMYLTKDITDVQSFLNHVKKNSIESLLDISNKFYATNYT